MEASKFSQEELFQIKQVFDHFDNDSTQSIRYEDLYEILTNLNKDPQIIESLLEKDSQTEISFAEFVELLENLEEEPKEDLLEEAEEPQDFEEESIAGPYEKVLDFLRLLEEYRKKCEEDGNYTEANKAKAKYDELKKKETLRQLNSIRSTQEKELQEIENSQKEQFEEFTAAWDNYMSEYEATAYSSLEKLKEKHMVEYQEFHEKAMKEARAKVKHSKELLELRNKQNALARQKKYEAAEEVKLQADRLEAMEKEKHEAEIQRIVEKKEKKLKKQHQLALAALLKRIQRDRNEQIKHRMEDSQRLMQRNRNIMNDVINKQNGEAKKTIEEIKRKLGISDIKLPGKKLKGKNTSVQQ